MVEHRPLTSAAAAGNSTTTTFSSDFFDVVIDTAAPAIANVSAKGALGNFTFGFDQHVYAYDSFFNASLGAVSGSYCFRPLGPPEKVGACWGCCWRCAWALPLTTCRGASNFG